MLLILKHTDAADHSYYTEQIHAVHTNNENTRWTIAHTNEIICMNICRLSLVLTLCLTTLVYH
jgi:hypothetical protein